MLVYCIIDIMLIGHGEQKVASTLGDTVTYVCLGVEHKPFKISKSCHIVYW
jgi:hypothetical protein